MTQRRTAAAVWEEQGIQDERGFPAFFEESYLPVVRAIFLFTGNHAESEDLVQEAMARAYERWEHVERMASPAGYVYRTAVNLHRRRARRRAAFRRLAPDLVRPQSDAISAVLDRADVARALARLPARLREALILVDWLELSGAEAAAVLGIEPASVRSRVSRGRAALRSFLEEPQ